MSLSPQDPRPPRLCVTDELGRLRTLDAGPESRVRLIAGSPSSPLLVLGAGPNPAAFSLSSRTTYWLESPDFISQMPSEWAVPAHWQAVAPSDLHSLPPDTEIWQYRAAPKLFPSFWGPILGSLHADRLPRPPDSTDPVVILPRTTLMHRELCEAFAMHGQRVLAIPAEPAKAAAATLDILQNESVALFLSLNFEGLDAGGELFHLLRARHIPVAVWLADNPWHILSRLQQPWWRGVRLFVTDPSFVDPLRAHGATSVAALPLAAWRMPVVPAQPTSTPLIFVGHSTFAQRDRFFAGLKLPPALWNKALALLDTDTPPNLLWWQQRLAVRPQWPGLDCRLPGFGAEQVALERRTRFLRACAPLGLTVYGDPGWADRLPATVALQPPVDYNSTLGGLYAASRYTLNVTSLQLPCGLTQRHFDVWQAGGFLLTDRTPGLDLFPRDLTEPISATCPAHIPALVDRLERDPTLRQDLATAWQSLIRERHQYSHRVPDFLS